MKCTFRTVHDQDPLAADRNFGQYLLFRPKRSGNPHGDVRDRTACIHARRHFDFAPLARNTSGLHESEAEVFGVPRDTDVNVADENNDSAERRVHDSGTRLYQ